MLGAVMNGMEAPKKFPAVLQPMAPIHRQVTQQNDFQDLRPPRLRTDSGTKRGRHSPVKPTSEKLKHAQHASAPEQVLTQEESKISEPVRPE
jgi:hypothetical protein